MKPESEVWSRHKTVLHTLAYVMVCLVLLAGCAAPEEAVTPMSLASVVPAPRPLASPTSTTPPSPQAFSLALLHSNDVAGELEPCG